MVDEAELSERMERALTVLEEYFAAGEYDAVRMAAPEVERFAREYGSEIILCGLEALLARLKADRAATPAERRSPQRSFIDDGASAVPLRRARTDPK